MWATDHEMQNEKSETDYKVGPRKSQKYEQTIRNAGIKVTDKTYEIINGRHWT